MKQRGQMTLEQAKGEFYIKSKKTKWNTIEKKYRAMIKDASSYKAPTIKQAYKVLLKEYGKKNIRFDVRRNTETQVPYEARGTNYDRANKKSKKGDEMKEAKAFKKVSSKASRDRMPMPYKANRTNYFKMKAEQYGNPRKDPSKINKRANVMNKPKRVSQYIKTKYNTENTGNPFVPFQLYPPEQSQANALPPPRQSVAPAVAKSAPAVKPYRCPSQGREPNRQMGYKAQVLIFHPDKNPSCKAEATRKFKKLNNLFSKRKPPTPPVESKASAPVAKPQNFDNFESAWKRYNVGKEWNEEDDEEYTRSERMNMKEKEKRAKRKFKMRFEERKAFKNLPKRGNKKQRKWEEELYDYFMKMVIDKNPKLSMGKTIKEVLRLVKKYK